MVWWCGEAGEGAESYLLCGGRQGGSLGSCLLGACQEHGALPVTWPVCIGILRGWHLQMETLKLRVVSPAVHWYHLVGAAETGRLQAPYLCSVIGAGEDGTRLRKAKRVPGTNGPLHPTVHPACYLAQSRRFSHFQK